MGQISLCSNSAKDIMYIPQAEIGNEPHVVWNSHYYDMFHY